ncbi:hypothetical protein FACS1894151_01630 [Spirochaetia bacterium]|nr:hypothetical protein FACS1894151_01630 [Spirochaetia bacterium]
MKTTKKRNKLFFIGMLSMALVFGITVMSCGDKRSGDPTSPSSTDPGGGGTGGSSRATASTLVNNTWTSGALISKADEVDWYKFEAVGGQAYFLTWDESRSGGNHTCDIKVSAYQSDGSTTLNGILNADSGYSAPKIISGYTGTVYIKVEARASWDLPTGTYAIKYEADTNGTMATATALTEGVFTSGTEIRPAGDIDWYTFQATNNQTYFLTWDGSGGSGNYTGGIDVSVYQSDGITAINGILNASGGYSTPKIISGYTGKVYIKVKGSAGSYIIKYEADTDGTKETADTLINGTWTSDTAISPAGDVDWYKFTAASGKTYSLTWDGGSYTGGSGNYTGYIDVSAYQSDGSTVLNSILNATSGYSSPKTISGYTGTVYIKVRGAGSGSTGTYAIKVTAN